MPDASENLAESANSQTAYSADQIAKNLGLDAAARGETEKVLAKILKKSILEDLKNTQTPKNISRPPTPPPPSPPPSSPPKNQAAAPRRADEPKKADEPEKEEGPRAPAPISAEEAAGPFTAPVATTPEGLPAAPSRADEPSHQATRPETTGEARE